MFFVGESPQELGPSERAVLEGCCSLEEARWVLTPAFNVSGGVGVLLRKKAEGKTDPQELA